VAKFLEWFRVYDRQLYWSRIHSNSSPRWVWSISRDQPILISIRWWGSQNLHVCINSPETMPVSQKGRMGEIISCQSDGLRLFHPLTSVLDSLDVYRDFTYADNGNLYVFLRSDSTTKRAWTTTSSLLPLYIHCRWLWRSRFSWVYADPLEELGVSRFRTCPRRWDVQIHL